MLGWVSLSQYDRTVGVWTYDFAIFVFLFTFPQFIVFALEHSTILGFFVSFRRWKQEKVTVL